ncbi:hypothetical protein VULLAG_LOCUS19913 [Vulpes lagopus]
MQRLAPGGGGRGGRGGQGDGGVRSLSSLFTWSQRRGQAGRGRECVSDTSRLRLPTPREFSEAASASLRPRTAGGRKGREATNSRHAVLETAASAVIHNPADRKPGLRHFLPSHSRKLPPFTPRQEPLFPRSRSRRVPGAVRKGPPGTDGAAGRSVEIRFERRNFDVS